MIIDQESGTRIDEIAPETYRISIPVSMDALPGGFSFNHFLIAGAEPLLFHTGYLPMFDLVRRGVAAVLDPAKLRWIGYSHYEPDESGNMDNFLGLAPQAQAFTSEIGGMLTGTAFTRPTMGLADGAVFQAGAHRMRWLATPHVPHGWDCGIVYDETTGTLFSGDLFTQGGRDCVPVTETEILSASEVFRKPLDYYAHSVHAPAILEKLALLNPTTLACQHGSTYRGNGAALLRELAGVLTREADAVRMASPV